MVLGFQDPPKRIGALLLYSETRRNGISGIPHLCTWTQWRHFGGRESSISEGDAKVWLAESIQKSNEAVMGTLASIWFEDGEKIIFPGRRAIEELAWYEQQSMANAEAQEEPVLRRRSQRLRNRPQYSYRDPSTSESSSESSNDSSSESPNDSSNDSITS